MAVATVVTISTAKRAHVVFIVFKIGLVIHFSILIVPVSPGCHAITQRLAHLSGVTAGITTAVHGLVVADVPARFIPSRRGRSPAFASQLGTLHASRFLSLAWRNYPMLFKHSFAQIPRSKKTKQRLPPRRVGIKPDRSIVDQGKKHWLFASENLIVGDAVLFKVFFHLNLLTLLVNSIDYAVRCACSVDHNLEACTTKTI